MTTYEIAKQAYAKYGVDTDSILNELVAVPLSIHCWQGDDVGGFERPNATLGGGGIQTTGNYPGKARSIEELRLDLEKVLTMVPGTHRLNLHASYGEFGTKFVDRNEIEIEHFQGWLDWAKKHNLCIDFNGTFFSHPLAEDGYTLSSKDETIRTFWLEHLHRCRKIAAWIGREQNNPCVLNTWIPDGAKNLTVDKFGYRAILKESLDEAFKVEYPKTEMIDALETKLFGLGSEAFVVGSHEFYMNYAIRNNKMLCIDMGHFHPEEDISDKLSSLLLFDDEILLHLSRPMRWDSDHVVLFNDKVKMVAEELVRSGKLATTHIGLDFFDASINRIGAWVTGTRAVRKALLFAMLQPLDLLLEYEEADNGYAKMALLEQQNILPFGFVWDEFCRRENVALDEELISLIERYEQEVLKERL